MKGAKMNWQYEEKAERAIRAEAKHYGWSQMKVDREIALISIRYDAKIHPDDLFAVTAELDRFPEGYEYDDCDYVRAFVDGATAFRAVFGEVA